MKHVMLDLETMGSGPRAAIVAIGACCFEPETGRIGETFYQAIDLESSVDLGYQEAEKSGSTLHYRK